VDDVGQVLDRVQERARAVRRKDRAPEAAGLELLVLGVLIAAIATDAALRVRWGLL